MPVLKLTAAALPKLSANGKRCETYRDTVVRGLILEVHGNTGVRTFVAWGRVRATGRAFRMKLGRFQPGVYELARAREDAKRVLAQAIDEDPTAARRREKEAGTFGAAAETYLKASQPNLRSSTYEQWRRLLNNKDLAPLRGRTLTSITRNDIVSLVDRIYARNRKAGKEGYIANKYLEVIRRVFNWSIERGHLDPRDSPFLVRVPPPHKEQPRRVHYDDDQLAAIVKALRHTATDDGIRLAIYTGARIHQAMGTPWGEVHFDEKEWHVAATRTGNKSGLPLIVPLVDEALEVFERRRGNDKPLVFPTASGRPARREWTVINRIRKVSGVAEFTPHDLRRTINSWLARARVPLEVRDGILGHKPRGLETVYNQYQYLDEKREALQRWAAHVRRIVEGEAAVVVKMPGA